MAFDPEKARTFIDQEWTSSIIPKIEEYISIPNQSQAYDYNPELAKKAANLLCDWVNAQKIEGAKAEIRQMESRSPLILVVVEATKPASSSPPTVLMYGHFDKQPPMDGWTAPYEPYKPYLDKETGKLYGRGGADDGYAIFALVTSIQALKKQNIPHDRYVIIIEGDEESGSGDVEEYVKELKDVIQTPKLIVCTDSGGGNYDQLWLTTSLRGYIEGTLDVKILKEASHSGSASGIVPSTFHIQRTLVDRLESGRSGVVDHPSLNIEITQDIKDQAKELAGILGDSVFNEFTFVEGAQPITKDVPTLIINNYFKPTLCITGVSGIPTIESGQTSNVLRVNTKLMLSIRVPPGLDSDKAAGEVKDVLQKDPPFGSQVTYTKIATGNGWRSKQLSGGWLGNAADAASQLYFGKKYISQGAGGSIPLISHLASLYPSADFVVTGVLGPNSNAHGPNEFLHTKYAMKVTACISYILHTLSVQK